MFEKKILCNEELYNIYLKYKSCGICFKQTCNFLVSTNLKHFFSSEFWKIIFKKHNLNFLISVRFKKKNIIL